MMEAPTLERVGERGDDVLLPGQLREVGRTPLAGKDLIAHRMIRRTCALRSVPPAGRPFGLMAIPGQTEKGGEP
jgi:hypothetical protein